MKLELIITLDNVQKTVILSQPNGNSGSYHIYLENYFHGQIVRYSGKWTAVKNAKSELTEAHLEQLVELVEKIK